MLDIKTFKSALEQLEEEKKIPKEKILDAIEQAMAAAYKKDYGKKGQIIRAKFDLETGKTDFFQVKIVVDETIAKINEEGEEETHVSSEYSVKEEDGDERVRFNSEHHIMLEDAKKIKKGAELNDEIIFFKSHLSEMNKNTLDKFIVLRESGEKSLSFIVKSFFLTFSIIGAPKARVFPEPVMTRVEELRLNVPTSLTSKSPPTVQVPSPMSVRVLSIITLPETLMFLSFVALSKVPAYPDIKVRVVKLQSVISTTAPLSQSGSKIAVSEAPGAAEASPLPQPAGSVVFQFVATDTLAPALPTQYRVTGGSTAWSISTSPLTIFKSKTSVGVCKFVKYIL